MPQPYIKKILEARVYDVAEETPLEMAPFLSERLGNQVLLKREDLQPVFSFKIRGAYNKIANLTPEQQARGVICASAGNHAQGVALAAKHLGLHAIIVMPQTTPPIKVRAVRARGADVVLHGDSFDQALAYALQEVDEHGYTFVHPYDDPDTIAGQGTIAMEILRQHSGDLDALFVPVGGGGLIAGVAAYIKYLRPTTQVIGVEFEESACLKAALEAGERVCLNQVGIFADGVAVSQIGEETFRVCQRCVDAVITVSADEICAAVKDIYDDTRAITEPSGALGIAGLKKYVEQTGVHGQTLLAINSGANVNFDRLRYISEQAELGEKREAILAVTIPEQPGSFLAFCEKLGKRGITEFNYRYHDPQQAHIFVGVQTGEQSGTRAELITLLKDQGFPTLDLTDDEMAKLHIRHMVGGHSTDLANEELYRFEFPERPGALLHFLKTLGSRWNISLFHYRNHGAAVGRVLVGFQVAAEDEEHLQAHFSAIGYPWTRESDNPAYKAFLNSRAGQ